MKRIIVLLTAFVLIGSVSYSREHSPPDNKESITVGAMVNSCSFDLVKVGHLEGFVTKENLAVGISAPFVAPLLKQEIPASVDAAALFYRLNTNGYNNQHNRSVSLYRPVARNGIVQR